MGNIIQIKRGVCTTGQEMGVVERNLPKLFPGELALDQFDNQLYIGGELQENNSENPGSLENLGEVNTLKVDKAVRIAYEPSDYNGGDGVKTSGHNGGITVGSETRPCYFVDGRPEPCLQTIIGYPVGSVFWSINDSEIITKFEGNWIGYVVTLPASSFESGFSENLELICWIRNA